MEVKWSIGSPHILIESLSNMVKERNKGMREHSFLSIGIFGSKESVRVNICFFIGFYDKLITLYIPILSKKKNLCSQSVILCFSVLHSFLWLGKTCSNIYAKWTWVAIIPRQNFRVHIIIQNRGHPPCKAILYSLLSTFKHFLRNHIRTFGRAPCDPRPSTLTTTRSYRLSG